MSTTKQHVRDENSNTNVPDANGHNDLSHYAQDTLKEVLGWYGLQEPGDSTAPDHPLVRQSGGRNFPNGKAGRGSAIKTQQMSVPVGLDPGVEAPLDLTNGNHSPQSGLSSSGSSPSTSPSSSSVGQRGSAAWGGHRKLIGMRFLFPPLSDDTSLLERAHVWVARHDHKYFVGWQEVDLIKVDPLLRPITPITTHLYKLHMNRSEYCRNVKLKYCLESDSTWAQEFRDRLRKPASDGGFTGLCQAKIAAAELWRKYSENYRSHQARYPNPKSKYKMHPPGSDSLMMTNLAENEPGPSRCNKRKTSQEYLVGEEGGVPDNDSSCCTKQTRYLEGRYEEDIEYLCEDNEGMGEGRSIDDMNYDSDDYRCPDSPLREEKEEEKLRNEKNLNAEIENKQVIFHQGKQHELRQDAMLSQSLKEEPKSNRSTPTFSDRLFGQPPPFVPSMAAAAAAYYGMPLGMYGGPASQFQVTPSSDSSTVLSQPFMNPFAMSPPMLSDALSSPSSVKFTKQSSDKQHEYKRSERGLSFLFPSLSDHNLSLIDKVKITVMRHKNNYFLGWGEKEITKVDPLIRPKMLVTADIYKEYCHRNAMKYDSNLQFAMESPEAWAGEFRAKLLRPPSEGGFSSLCEVKLEAGRLWREFSGKYRMHNIVKWQMDLNNATKPSKQEKEGSPSADKQDACTETLQKSGMKKDSEKCAVLSEMPTSQKVDQEGQQIHPDQSPASISASSSLCNMPEGLGFRVSLSGAITPISAFPIGSRSYKSGQSQLSPEYFLPGQSATIELSNSYGSDLQSSLPTGLKLPVSSQDRSAITMPTSMPMTMPDMLWFPPSSQVPSMSPLHPTTSAFPPRSLPIESLFKPLPQHLSVAEQIQIWLQRHRHRYFLGYNRELLAKLDEFLCPQMVVTKEVFQRHIPESMVDVINKIDVIMASTDPLAIEFQNHVQKMPQRGGFSSFEEAVSQALHIWGQMKTSSILSTHRHVDKDKTTNYIGTPNITKPVMTSQKISTDSAIEDQVATCKITAHTDTEPSASRDHHLGENNANNDERDRKSDKAGDTTLNNEDAVKVQQSLDDGSPGKDSDEGENIGSAPTTHNTADCIWQLREDLQLLCGDNPQLSWVERLEPFLPTLQQHIGAGYNLPGTHTSCTVDLLLAALYEHMAEHGKTS